MNCISSYFFRNSHYVFSEKFNLPDSFKFESILNDTSSLPIYKEYKVIKSNGFVKLITNKALDYWQLQTKNHNRVPDWKIHFSIQDEYMPIAWNTLAELFIDKNCQFGMKATYDPFPDFMKGREITVYIFKWDPSFENSNFSKRDESSNSFWINFIEEAERRLIANGVVSNGTAEGDCPLKLYSSLRNEAFVPYKTEWKLPKESLCGFDIGNKKLEGQWVYPPNEAGFNAAHHSLPF